MAGFGPLSAENNCLRSLPQALLMTPAVLTLRLRGNPGLPRERFLALPKINFSHSGWSVAMPEL